MYNDTCCQVCGASNLRLLRCGQCQSVWYCSRDCQKKDWKKRNGSGSGGHKEECGPQQDLLRLAKETLEAMRPLREGGGIVTQTEQDDSDNNEEQSNNTTATSTPLVTGTLSAMDVVQCLFNHPDIDHNLRKAIVWTPMGDEMLHATTIVLNGRGERNAVSRVAYTKKVGEEA